MHSREIEELVKQFDSRRRGAVAESIRHTVESTDALTRATLLVAYGQLRGAEAAENLFKMLFNEFREMGVDQTPTGVSNASGIEFLREHEPSELKDLSAERVSIPK